MGKILRAGAIRYSFLAILTFALSLNIVFGKTLNGEFAQSHHSIAKLNSLFSTSRVACTSLNLKIKASLEKKHFNINPLVGFSKQPFREFSFVALFRTLCPFRVYAVSIYIKLHRLLI